MQEWKTTQSQLPPEDLCSQPRCNCVSPCSPSQRGSVGGKQHSNAVPKLLEEDEQERESVGRRDVVCSNNKPRYKHRLRLCAFLPEIKSINDNHSLWRSQFSLLVNNSESSEEHDMIFNRLFSTCVVNDDSPCMYFL